MNSFRKTWVWIIPGYLLLAAFLFYATRHRLASLIMVSGIAFFHLLWKVFESRFARYGEPVDEPGQPRRHSRASLVIMAALTVAVGSLAVQASFRGVDDKRMISAFHEDEGWIADLYDDYVVQKKLDLGEKWGYTYGSLNLMTVSVAARALRPVVELDGRGCVIINRLLLIAVFLSTGWLAYFIGRGVFRSDLAGLAAAGLLFTNAKAVEIALPSNYPDTFHMLFLTVSVYFTSRMFHRFSWRDAFFSVIALGLGFSVKYMGLPLALIIIIVFGYRQIKSHKTGKPEKPLKALANFGLFSLIVLAALPAAFFTVNPYYLIHFKKFMSQMSKLASLYSNPASMNNLSASTVKLPGLADWWSAGAGGGAPDSLVFVTVIIVFLLMLSGLRRKKRIDPQDSFVIVSFSFVALWFLFVIWRSKFAFFHYFLPVIPSIYLAACALPHYLNALIEGPLKRRAAFWAAGVIYSISLLVPLANDVDRELAGEPFFKRNSLGYAARDFARESRAVLTFMVLKETRSTEGNIAMEVGRWLKDNCPDARSLVTNETIFYYPPFIKDAGYWNRQMNLELLFRTMPDLLIVSDWFIDMYTKDYSGAEIASIAPESLNAFMSAREFYGLIKDKDEFLNYRRIKTFEAPVGWYWKRIHIYRREGPRAFSHARIVSGPSLTEPPNGKEVLFNNDFIMPYEVYLAAFPGNPVPSRLEFELDPVGIKGIGFVWYSPESHPAEAMVQGFRNGRRVFEEKMPLLSADRYPYGWVETDAEVDKIVLRVDKFKGQQRLLIKRMLMKTGARRG